MKYEEFKLCYRKPSEFKWSNDLFKIIKENHWQVWTIHFWREDFIYCWVYGIRFLGIELSWRKYIPNDKQNWSRLNND